MILIMNVNKVNKHNTFGQHCLAFSDMAKKCLLLLEPNFTSENIEYYMF